MKIIILATLLFPTLSHGMLCCVKKDRSETMQEILETIKELNPVQDIKLELSNKIDLDFNYFADHYPNIRRMVIHKEKKHARWTLETIENSGVIEIGKLTITHITTEPCDLAYRWPIRQLKPGVARFRMRYESDNKEFEQTQEFSVTVTE